MPDRDDQFTPPPADTSDIVWARIREIEGRLEREHEAINRVKAMAVDNREQLVELVGRSGQNGTVGRLRESVDELSDGLETVRDLAHELNAFRWKLVGASVVGAALAGGLVQIAIQFAGGL